MLTATQRLQLKKVEEVPYILTPKPADEPKINGAKVVGVRPGKPFLFYIPATGIRPMTFEARNLPQGLTVDANTGIISGKVLQKGDYKVELVAKNSKGEVKRDLTIKVGDQIMLTPPMGWNSWNCWGLSVDQQKVVQSAHVFKDKGLMN
ncbi:MAG TPA: putative Ig domain-containing protein, partial [Bacteroidales bacterium]|nr:putative Ig domain-containing protein [Bacteroidales bacterium]